METFGKVRVGRRVYNKSGGFIDPKVEGYSTVLCLTKSSPFGLISPYGLCDEQGRNMENIWQFSKVYPRVNATTCTYSRYDKRVIWSHPSEVHVDKNKRLLPAYFDWRRKGMAAKDAIRYPVGFHGRHACIGAVLSDVPVGQHEEEHKFLNYVESRRQIYLVLYAKLLSNHPMFLKLQQRSRAGENLLIVEVDGPHQESMDYYKEQYNVATDFIVDNTVDINQESIRILLNDTRHPFGHGYCLAMAILNKTHEWNIDLQGQLLHPLVQTPLVLTQHDDQQLQRVETPSDQQDNQQVIQQAQRAETQTDQQDNQQVNQQAQKVETETDPQVLQTKAVQTDQTDQQVMQAKAVQDEQQVERTQRTVQADQRNATPKFVSKKRGPEKDDDEEPPSKLVK